MGEEKPVPKIEQTAYKINLTLMNIKEELAKTNDFLEKLVKDKKE